MVISTNFNLVKLDFIRTVKSGNNVISIGVMKAEKGKGVQYYKKYLKHHTIYRCNSATDLYYSEHLNTYKALIGDYSLLFPNNLLDKTKYPCLLIVSYKDDLEDFDMELLTLENNLILENI